MSKKITKWVPFTKANFSAEDPFQIRFKADPTAVTTARFNQFGQLLNAEGRLVDPLPDEMEVTEQEPAAPAKP